PEGVSVTVLGLGPIGDMDCREAAHRGHRVIGVDLVPERLARVAARGVEVVDLSAVDGSLGDVIRAQTAGRGTDAVIDAVGMKAHGSPAGALAHRSAALLPDSVAQKVMDTAGIDRMAALDDAIDIVGRGGTLSLVGVYGGMADPLPMSAHAEIQVELR